MSTGTSRLSLPIGARDHIQGSLDAPVSLVEYGDYECPYCGAAYPIIKAIQAQAGADLCFVYRNFPLATIHPHAEDAAEVAEAAGAQGKFWPMHDMLFENQQTLEDAQFLAFASALELDTARVTSELRDHVWIERIREDFLSGIYSGVNGTPTFFINEERYDDLATFEDLYSAINQAKTERTRG